MNNPSSTDTNSQSTQRSLHELEVAMLQAHKQVTARSTSVSSLVDLYRKAYELKVNDDPTAAYFYLTNAYVYALDSNHPKTEVLEQLLKDADRL